MKRLLTTLVALVALIGTAWCAPVTKGAKVDVSSLRLRENVRVTPPPAPGKLTSMSAAQSASPQGVLKRLKAVGSDGTEWEMEFVQTGTEWRDLLNFTEGKPSFEDFPFYLVSCNISKKDKDGEWLHGIALPLFWPSNGNYSDAATFDAIIEAAGKDDRFSYNVFSTIGNVMNGEPCYQIWPYPQQEFQVILNGEPYYDNPLSETLPTTVTITGDGNGGYNVDTEINFASADLIGISDLKLNSHYEDEGSLPDLSVDLSNYSEIFLIGEPQGWDINNRSVPVPRISEDSRVYGGNLYIPAGKFMFRFYGLTGDWSSFSIGSQDDDSPVEISLDESGIYSGPLFEGARYSSNGKGSWSIPDWDGGRVQTAVNLVDGTVFFKRLEDPEVFYPVFNGDNIFINATDSPLNKVSDKIYEGIIDIPSELQGEGNVIPLYFSGNSDYETFNITSTGDEFTLGRVEKSCEISKNLNNFYVFRIRDYTGTRLQVTIDLASGTVRFSNPDVAPVTEEDIRLSFSPDTPETLVLGKAVDITVTYPAEVLDDYDIYFEGMNVADSRKTSGQTIFRVIPESVGEIPVWLYTSLHESLGVPRLERVFNVVAPDYAHTAGEEIYLKGRDNSGDLNLALTRISEGVYGGTVDLKGETAFRISVPTENGDVTLGNYNWWDEFYLDGERFRVNTGSWNSSDVSWQLQDITEVLSENPNSCYLGTRNNGSFKFTVDLNTMKASLRPADFNPYITVEQPEMKVRRNSDFIIRVKTNVGDDIFAGGRDGYITVDNPDIVSYDEWLNQEDDETFVYHFSSGDVSGTTAIHISSPILRGEGLEAVVNVTVGDFTTENITLSSKDVTMRQGDYATVTYKAEPFDDVWINLYSNSENMDLVVDYNVRSVLLLGREVGESEVFFRPNDNPELIATLKVTVLPADAKVAEHIVYTELEPEQRTRLTLDVHQDGAEATPSWSSSDESVAVVDADGRVTALKAGRAVITADCGIHQVMAGIHVKNSTDVEEVAVRNVKVYSQGTAVTVIGTEEGDTVNVFAADGSLMTSRRSDGGKLSFDLGVRGAFIVTVGAESFKVVL